MRKVLLLVLLAAALITSPGYAFSQNKMKLSGTVSDSTKPLALVTVRIYKKINQPALVISASSNLAPYDGARSTLPYNMPGSFISET